MTSPEMRLLGDENGDVAITCSRKGCLVKGILWLEIPLPYDATPMIVERMWMEHRLAHANRER